MLYQIFDDMTQCSEQEVARLLPLVSAQRREQALRFTHLFGRYCCLKSYEMLLQLLASAPYILHSTPTFLYNEYGAPSIKNGPYFSISHCKSGIAVAVSNQPIGIDIEAVRPLKVDLVKKTMNPLEQEIIFSDTQPDWAFTRQWTRKEAFLKMKGTGIISDLHEVLSDVEGVEWQQMDNKLLNYTCCIVVQKM
jgi:4'-phosphopantetheinyl transferase